MRPILDPCADWRAQASAELDGELDEFDRLRLRLHLAGCSDCTAWLREMGLVQEMLAASAVDLEQQIAVGRLRRISMRAVSAAVASGAAAALAAVAIGLPGGNGAGSSPVQAATAPSIASVRIAVATARTCTWCLDRQTIATLLLGQAPQESVHGPVLT